MGESAALVCASAIELEDIANVRKGSEGTELRKPKLFFVSTSSLTTTITTAATCFSQHLQQHFHRSLFVRGRGRGPSSPTIWTIFLISSHLKLNQDWMMTVQRRGRASSSCIGSQQHPPPRPQPSPKPSPSGAYSVPHQGP